MAAATKTSADTFRASILSSHTSQSSPAILSAHSRKCDAAKLPQRAIRLTSQGIVQKENENAERDQHKGRDPSPPTPNWRDQFGMFDHAAGAKTPYPDQYREDEAHQDLYGGRPPGKERNVDRDIVATVGNGPD